MTFYAGEQFRVTGAITDYDGVVLTDENVDGVVVNIYDSAKELVLTSAMTWDVDEALWVYLWDTTGLDPGSYRYQIVATGADGRDSWEWRRVRFARSPVAP
jgi:hypothetical protein